MSNETPEQPASRAAVAGMAREVEALRRRLDTVAELPRRVRELAKTVAQLSVEVAERLAAGETEPPTSWLDLSEDETWARQVLDDLVLWVLQVFLRYSDTHDALPECWLWHPDIVEELLWLMQAWTRAYRGDNGTVTAAADWHDRYRPGVVRRIGELSKNCSLDNHAPRGGQPEPRPMPVADPDTRAQIATWWGASREAPAPRPTAEQLADGPGPARPWTTRRADR